MLMTAEHGHIAAADHRGMDIQSKCELRARQLRKRFSARGALYLNGFSTRTPEGSKSLTWRVSTVRL